MVTAMPDHMTFFTGARQGALGPFLAAVILAAAFEGCAASSAATSPSVDRVLPADMDRLLGAAWHGTLTYLDYKSHKPVSLRTTLLVSRLPCDPPKWEERLGYDDEPKANRATTLTLSADGRQLDGEAVLSREALADGTVRAVTEGDGEDDNKPVRFRHIYLLGAKQSSLKKLVRFAGAQEFFERNVYEWKRE